MRSPELPAAITFPRQPGNLTGNSGEIGFPPPVRPARRRHPGRAPVSPGRNGIACLSRMAAGQADRRSHRPGRLGRDPGRHPSPAPEPQEWLRFRRSRPGKGLDNRPGIRFCVWQDFSGFCAPSCGSCSSTDVIGKIGTVPDPERAASARPGLQFSASVKKFGGKISPFPRFRP